jgi:hypothetical protein
MNEYYHWVDENVPAAYGKCAAVTLNMQQMFPELERVRGHYCCWVWGRREHWWLVAPDGAIIDPTASQFPSKGNGEYIPWQEGAEEPTGICMNCGDYVYSDLFCSKRCEVIVMADYR